MEKNGTSLKSLYTVDWYKLRGCEPWEQAYLTVHSSKKQSVILFQKSKEYLLNIAKKKQKKSQIIFIYLFSLNNKLLEFSKEK